MQTIDSDNETTWPVDLTEGLASREAELRAFDLERRRIDKAAQQDVMLRINPPLNPHQQAWNDILDLASRTTSASHILGFHATRLTNVEAADVTDNGMRTLSTTLLDRRVAQLLDTGALTSNDATALRGNNQISESNRSGMIWFVFTRASLRNQSGIERLFRSWGGEALYNSHEDDDRMGPILRGIGSPRIIVASVPVAGLQCFMDVGQRLVNIWCAKRAIRTGHGAEFEGYVRSDVPKQSILRVIDRMDPEFLALTGHTVWDEPL